MPAALSKAELFSRLAEGHAAGVTVVTPNKRLSQALMAEFDVYQTQKNLTVWEAPDILPFGAFVERLWEDALYSDLGETLPLLLTPGQEQHLWEEILAKSGLLIVPQAAAQCREAWRLMHQWSIRPGSGNEDLEAFSRWASAYAQRTAGEVDAARLPDLMAQHLLKKPKLLVAYGFDVMPPQTAEFLSKFEHAFCVPEPVDGQCIRSSYPSAKHEIEAAAKWARARLEEGNEIEVRARFPLASASSCSISASGAPKCNASSPASCSRATTSPHTPISSTPSSSCNSPIAVIADPRTEASESSRAFDSNSVAAGSPSMPSEKAADARTSGSLSFSARASGSKACRSLIWPSANAAASRTVASLSDSASTSAGTPSRARSDPICPAAARRVAASLLFRSASSLSGAGAGAWPGVALTLLAGKAMSATASAKADIFMWDLYFINTNYTTKLGPIVTNRARIYGIKEV